MLIAAGAVLLPLHPLGMLTPVLVTEVIAFPALSAFQDDLFARHGIL
jgi:hypothetical protein